MCSQGQTSAHPSSSSSGGGHSVLGRGDSSGRCWGNIQKWLKGKHWLKFLKISIFHNYYFYNDFFHNFKIIFHF